MAVAKMKLVNIVGRLKDFDSVVQNCCISGDFHPEQSSQALENTEGFIPLEETNPYEKAMQKTVDIGVHSDITLKYNSFDQLEMTFEELSAYMDSSGNALNILNGNVTKHAQTAARLEQILTQLKHIKDFGINLDDLFNCKNIIFRFGRLPKESFPKLDIEENDNYLFFPFEEDNLYLWGFYVMQNQNSEAVDEFFTALYFERIDIIKEAHGKPQDAAETITLELKKTDEQLKAARNEVKKYWNDNIKTFLQIYSHIRYLHDSFELRRYASKHDENFYIFGWVTEKDIVTFEKRFDHFTDVDCIVETTQEAVEISPPTHLVNNSLSKPFENYVGMYGLPSYNEIDPTPIMSITYAVIFGIMFGDIGQGFVILLVALFMKFKKKMFLGDIMIRCSLFSIFFGALYCSVFGYEEVLPFPALLPIHEQANTNYVLLISVGLGILLIMFCMVLNIINGIRQKNIEKFLFSQNGIAGLIFYVSVITAAVLMMIFSTNIITPIFISLLIIIPLLLVAFKEPLSALCERKKDWLPKNKGEFLVLTIFEMFEILLSFISNTISYVRIGAFILSHTAMMIAVFTIAQMTGNASPVVIVIGNVFVICLEGLIVGIQGLRLQFYEIFSRFYDGGGKAYEPAKIKYEI
jgi:V/A-type H+-transporting ATPase subunit I